MNGKTQTYQERRTRWRSVSGQVARFFNDVLVMASNSLPRTHTDALEPWDLGALAPYRPDYLSGFAAEAYQVELEEGFTDGARQDGRGDRAGHPPRHRRRPPAHQLQADRR